MLLKKLLSIYRHICNREIVNFGCICVFNLSFYPVNKARFIENYARDILLEIISIYAQSDSGGCQYTSIIMPPDPLSCSTVSCGLTASVSSVDDIEYPVWFKLSKEYYNKLHSSMSTRVHTPTTEAGKKYRGLQNGQIDPAQEARAALLNLDHNR